MVTITLDQSLIENLIRISKNAGEAIMGIYESDFSINTITDQSPLTKADLLSNIIICQSLKEITPEIPILSEESCDIPYQERMKWKQYWLVDPLDGTKEFIKKNGEFTVNIALINKNRPVFGVIHSPVLNETYWGSEDYGSFMQIKDQDPESIRVSKNITEIIRVISSRSHKDNNEISFLNRIGNHTSLSIGSSLKFCYLAKGQVDIYPRFGKTSEWDIAAGDAILSYAGGRVIDKNNSIFSYNSKESLINESFFAFGDKGIGERFTNEFIDISNSPD